MTTLKKIGDGDKVNTPHITKMLQEDMIEGLMKDYQNPKEDIIDEMTYPCGVCKGSGYDTEIKNALHRLRRDRIRLQDCLWE